MVKTELKNITKQIGQIDMSGHCWYLNNLLRREDGPPVKYINISLKTKYWFYHRKWIECSSQEEFERLIKLKSLW